MNLYLLSVPRRLSKKHRFFYKNHGDFPNRSASEAVPWPIMFYFYKLLLGWRVVSFAVIPHLPISIYLLGRYLLVFIFILYRDGIYIYTNKRFRSFVIFKVHSLLNFSQSFSLISTVLAQFCFTFKNLQNIS